MDNPKILVVDDDSHTAWSLGSDLQYHLKTMKLDLMVFTDAQEAIDYITSSPKGGIWGAIIDLWMLDKNTRVEKPDKGNEIIAVLRKTFPKVKMVVLSAHIDERAKQSLFDSKVVAFKKPANTAEVFEALKGNI